MPIDKIKPPISFPTAYGRAVVSLIAMRAHAEVYGMGEVRMKEITATFHECLTRREALLAMRKGRAFLRSMPHFPADKFSQEAARLPAGKCLRCKLIEPGQHSAFFRAAFRVGDVGEEVFASGVVSGQQTVGDALDSPARRRE